MYILCHSVPGIPLLGMYQGSHICSVMQDGKETTGTAGKSLHGTRLATSSKPSLCGGCNPLQEDY